MQTTCGHIYEVHTKLATEKGYHRSLYPKAMSDELVKLDKDVIFVVAEVQDKIAGAFCFFAMATRSYTARGDGSTVFAASPKLRDRGSCHSDGVSRSAEKHSILGFNWNRLFGKL